MEIMIWTSSAFCLNVNHYNKMQLDWEVSISSYLLKVKLRLIFKFDDIGDAKKELCAWVKWVRHCRIAEFVELQRRSMRHKEHILNTIRLRVNNARIEATNNI